MFSEKIKELRVKKGITQETLAKEIYVSCSTICKWETGLGYPSNVNLKSLCEYFGVNEDEILDRNDLKNNIKGYKATVKILISSFSGIFVASIFMTLKVLV